MSTVEGIAHGLQPPFQLVVVDVTKKFLLVLTEPIGDGIHSLFTQDGCLRRVDTHTILHIETTNLNEFSQVGPIVSDKLCHHRHGFRGVNCITSTTTIESLVAHSERVYVTSIFIANTFVALSLFVITTRKAFASELSINTASMRRVRIGHTICFPDIHLCTTSAIVAHPHVVTFIFGIRPPVDDIGLPVDKLDVMGALCVAITSAIFRSCVVMTFTHPAEFVHFYKIHRTIHATKQIGHININGKLTVLQVEQFVFVFTIKHI